MAKVVVVKFKRNCKFYYFSAGDFTLTRGQGVIVETTHGPEYGTVVEAEHELDEKKAVAPLKPVIRPATEKDTETLLRNEERRVEALKICKEKIRKHKLVMKLIDCEFAFDGSKILFTFSAEGRIDFRELVKDLASVFHNRIELRQVGIRDEARLLGGMAPCGREVCCAGCMPEFKKVSIKMAKSQGLSLNPGKISGLCGRLMCCLAYESDYYASIYKKMPKLGSVVETPEGSGAVVGQNMLRQEVRVKVEKEGVSLYRDFPISATKYTRTEGDYMDKKPADKNPDASEKKPAGNKPNGSGKKPNDKKSDGSGKKPADKKSKE